jgi:DNA-binding NarL/FixJ family response regulator
LFIDDATANLLADLHVALGELRLARGERDTAEASARRGVLLAQRGGALDVAAAGRRLRERLAEAAAGAPPAGGASKRAVPGLVEPLTAREGDVLRLLAAGRSNRQIAADLVVALGTVKFHVHAVYGKLAAENRVHAVARARALGLVG